MYFFSCGVLTVDVLVLGSAFTVPDVLGSAVPGFVIFGCTVRALFSPVFVEVLAGAISPGMLLVRPVLACA